MNKSNLIFLDTETTGTGPKDRLCQVAYKFNGEEFESLFKPPLPIEIDAMAVAHITNKMVADKEPFEKSKMKKHLEEILAENILVAHNAKFDVEMLQRENLVVPKIIDTYKIAHHLDTEEKIPKYGLQYLRYFHELEVEDASAHSALGDVKVLEKVFEVLFSQMEKLLGDEEKVLEKMMEVSASPILFRKFNFGKYIGQPVSEVAKTDKNYLLWFFNQKIMERERGEGNDENWIYTIDFYLNPKKK
jgi:DNA polymerase III epsilon subunit-like protein